MTTRALLIEIDEAVGRWLSAVLGEAGLEVDWHKDAAAGGEALRSPQAAFGLCVVEGVMGGPGVELCGEAKRAGLPAVLLLPRGSEAPPEVADRILEHPLTRTGLLQTLAELGFSKDQAPPPPKAQPEPAVDEEEQRLQAAAQDRIRLGLEALHEGNLDAAVMELDAAAALTKGDVRPRLYAAWARYSRLRGAVTQATQLRRELAELADEASLADGAYFVATAAHDVGDAQTADAEVKRALSLEPGHASAQKLQEILAEKAKGSGTLV